MSVLQTKKTMDKMEIIKGYEIFAMLMEEEKVYMNPLVTFDTVCSWIGVGRHDLDCYIKAQLGCGGTDIMKAYRDSIPSHFLQKYGILL